MSRLVAKSMSDFDSRFFNGRVELVHMLQLLAGHNYSPLSSYRASGATLLVS